jgi:hypothetical protein
MQREEGVYLFSVSEGKRDGADETVWSAFSSYREN